jgi:potassium efflux system protein
VFTTRRISALGTPLLALLMLSTVVLGQPSEPVITLDQVDGAVADLTATTTSDDPQRAKLLALYNDTRAALADRDGFLESREKYAQARAGAEKEALAIGAALAERHVASLDLPASTSLAELEQQMQVGSAELAAIKSNLDEIRNVINRMPGRAAEIRAKLTDLGSLIPDLQSALALTKQVAEAGSVEEANLWWVQAQMARAIAEKAALDEELLSQPMRLQLLAAKQDRSTQDIRQLERHLSAMEQRAKSLRQGEATQARAEAEKVLAGAQGKHALVQQLADENAELSASFSQRGEALDLARERAQVIGDRAEQLEIALKDIERKVNILGMNAAVGHALREQQVQLPSNKELKTELARVNAKVTTASVRQLELEDERGKLFDTAAYVDKLIAGLDTETRELVYPDILELASKRRDLIRQALDLENLYTNSLSNLQYDLRRYKRAIKDYRHFIQERLLWIPSRDPFSLFRANGLPAQLGEIFVAESWAQEARLLPGELLRQPLAGLALALVLVLVYRSRSIKARIVASGREVGYVRTDKFSNTMAALVFSVILSVKWPLLMWAIGRLFEQQEVESSLAVALHAALSQGALYFWGLELLRVVMMPRGLVVSHFRWPAQRAMQTYEKLVVLERTFLPSVLLVSFSIALYPREIGGPLGAIAVILLLLSIAYFFRYLPSYMEGKVTMLFTDRPYSGSSVLGRFMRHLLVWVPIATIIAVILGYIYTAGTFSLLLIKTAAACAGVLLLNELAMRWLRMTRRRMVARVRAESAQASTEDGGISPEEEALENDPELLNDEGTKLINLLTLFGLLGAILAIWAEVLPAFGILDSVQLWHQSSVVDGQEVPVPVTLRDVALALAIAVLGWVALSRIPGLLEILLRQKMGVRAASAYAATRVFQYAATGALVAGVLSSMGGSWSQIQWAVAALSVGIGFGLQEIVANFISGLIILFEQPIRVGDVVTVGNTSGRVTKIRIRATTIRDFDRRELLVPNKEFITQQLLNWSLSDQVTRITIEVGVAYGTDLDRALAIVREAAMQHPVIVNDPEPIVTFEEFGDNSLLIRIRFFLDQLDTRLETTSELMLDINRRLKAAGIVVAYPQRDVHLDTSEPLEIRMTSDEPLPRHDQPGGQ